MRLHALLAGTIAAVQMATVCAAAQSEIPELTDAGISMTPAVPPPGALDQPVDRGEYTVGPGDQFVLSFWGEVNRSVPITVTPEGSLILPVGGAVPVAGLSITDAEGAVVGRLEDYYHDTEMSLSLLSPRILVIHVTGAVESPGGYGVPASTRVSSAIDLAGGVLADASLRRIVIRGSGDEERGVDLVRYARLGDLASNPMVAEGGVIHVPFDRDVVEVWGAVNCPGPYEILRGERLVDALELAGGLRPDANPDDVEIVRFLEERPDEYISFAVDLTSPAPLAGGYGLPLRDGDKVLVHRIEGWHQDSRVDVRGEVRFPGAYSIVDGRNTLGDVVQRAGGPTAAADLSRAVLVRSASVTQETGADRELRLMEESGRDDLDHEEYEFLRAGRVEVAGQFSVDLEALLVHGDADADVVLYGGDVVEFPRYLDVVRVSGAVVRPGCVRFEKGARARHYVELTGGYADDADRGGTRVVKGQTGQRLRPSRRVRIEPGDTVWVPREEERNWFEVTKEVLSIVSQVATIYILIEGIRTTSN